MRIISFQKYLRNYRSIYSYHVDKFSYLEIETLIKDVNMENLLIYIYDQKNNLMLYDISNHVYHNIGALYSTDKKYKLLKRRIRSKEKVTFLDNKLNYQRKKARDIKYEERKEGYNEEYQGRTRVKCFKP